jgi:hypothetical protein
MKLGNIVRRRRATICGIAAGMLLLIFPFCNFDIIQFERWFAAATLPHWIDDGVVAVAFVIIGNSIDRRREKRQRELELLIQANRLSVLKATMRTVQDIMNNFINSMQLVQLEAGDALSPEASALLERITHEATTKLRDLGNLDSVPETEMAVGTGIGLTRTLPGP